MSKRRKAANGSGSVWAEGERWRAQLTLPNGTRERRTFSTREAAEAWLLQTRAGLLTGQRAITTDRRLTLAHHLDEWLETVVKPHREPKTYIQHEQSVRLHLKPWFGQLLLSDLTPRLVQQFVNAKRQQYSPNYVRLLRNTLRVACAQAVEWDAIPRNPVRRIAMPAIEPEHVEAISPEEAQRLLDALRGHRLYALYLVTLGLGLRAGEVLGLRWEDWNERAGTLHVRRQLQRIPAQYSDLGGHFSTKSPKAHSQRVLHLPAGVAAELRRHRERQREEAAGGDPGLMFRSSRGEPLNNSTVTHTLQRLLTRAGLPSIRLHLLRHYSASLLLALGCTMHEVSVALGHRDVTVTMKVYAHLGEAQRANVARVMQILFDGEEGTDAASG